MSILAFACESSGTADPSMVAPLQLIVTPDPSLPRTMSRLVTTELLGSDKSQFTATSASSLLARCSTLVIVPGSQVEAGAACWVVELHPAAAIMTMRKRQAQEDALDLK